MLDAITRCPKLIRRGSTHKSQSNRRISSDEPRKKLETPRPSSVGGRSTGSLFSHGDSQRSGYSIRQTLVKLRQQRLRPLSIFTGNPKFIRNHRVSHSSGSMESIGPEQYQVEASSRPQSTEKQSAHSTPRASLKHRGESAVMFHSEHVQDLPSILQSFNSMPEFPSRRCPNDNRKTWSYNLESQHCKARSPEKLVVEEESDGSLDDEMLDTLCALRYTIQRINEHQRQSKSSPLSKCESLPPFGLAAAGHHNLSRTFSVPSRCDQRRPTSSDIHAGLSHSLVCPTRLPTDQPSAMHGNHSDTMIANEFDSDDTSSFCTLSEEEPDYKSIPYVLPRWPNLPPELRLTFDSDC